MRIYKSYITLIPLQLATLNLELFLLSVTLLCLYFQTYGKYSYEIFCEYILNKLQKDSL